MDGTTEPDRLRALLTLMRELGATRIVTPDGLTIERPPLSPLEAAAAFSVGQSTKGTAAASRDDVDEDIDGEERTEKDLRARWDEYWQRLTLSSNAGVPPFPGADKALRMLGAS